MPATKHSYRFRGSVQPTAEVKRPVRAELVAETDGTTGKLYLHDVIDSWGGYWGISAQEFNTALSELGDVSQINLHVNSPGGEVYEGIAILNALRRHPANVTAIVDGLAASAASFIAAGVDELVMGDNTELMIHDAWGIYIGPPTEGQTFVDRLHKISDNIADVYAKKTGTAADSIRQLMIAETWYSAQEAVDAGLADRVEGDLPDDPGVIVENAFDLSVFKNQGREKAAPPPPLDGGLPADEDVLPDDDGRTRRQRQNRNRLNLAHKRARVTAGR